MFAWYFFGVIAVTNFGFWLLVVFAHLFRALGFWFRVIACSAFQVLVAGLFWVTTERFRVCVASCFGSPQVIACCGFRVLVAGCLESAPVLLLQLWGFAACVFRVLVAGCLESALVPPSPALGFCLLRSVTAGAAFSGFRVFLVTFSHRWCNLLQL